MSSLGLKVGLALADVGRISLSVNNVAARAVQYARSAWQKVIHRKLENANSTEKFREVGRVPAESCRKQGEFTFLKEFIRGEVSVKNVIRNNLLKQQKLQESLAANMQRKSPFRSAMSLNLMRRGLPLYGFVGVALASNTKQNDVNGYAEVCENIRCLVSKGRSDEGEDLSISSFFGTHLMDYDIGKMIGKGCNAAVYEAKFRGHETNENEMDIISETGEGSEMCSTECTPPQTFLIDQMNPRSADSHCSQPIFDEESDVNSSVSDASGESSSFEVIANCSETTSSQAFDLELNDHSSLDDASPGSSFEVISNCSAITSSQVHVIDHIPQSLPDHFEEEYNLAIKVTFNYHAASNACMIMRSFQMEAVPARMAPADETMKIWENGHHPKKKWQNLPPHPNIVDMKVIFVDDFPLLESAQAEYPGALPTRLNPDGLGRNKTMFLVMNRYDTTLHQYVQDQQLSVHHSCLLLTQLLEGVVHMNDHGVAHRDLKSDNILLSLNEGCPQLVISDFGCCLANEDGSLKVPYQTDQVCKGGNPTLMAPEISTAIPESNSYLDYSKSDLWAVGCLAFEIFGGENPFYRSKQQRALNSMNYEEFEIPSIDKAPRCVNKLVKQILKRDPEERPDGKLVANMMHIIMWGPKRWRDLVPTKKEVISWLVFLSAEVRVQLSSSVDDVELKLKQLFLSRVDLNEIMSALYVLSE